MVFLLSLAGPTALYMVLIPVVMLVVVVEDPTDSFEDTEGSLGILLLFGYIRPQV